jgi:hypothetical protein
MIRGIVRLAGTMREKRVFPTAMHFGSHRGAAGSSLLVAVLTIIGVPACARHGAPPPIECVVDYGGEAHKIVVHPTSDPYRVPPSKIEDAFQFKAVYVAAPAPEATLDFYAYYVTERGPVIAEQTKYRPPFPRNAPSVNGNFTGDHHVYGPDGEELIYSCRWRSQ